MSAPGHDDPHPGARPDTDITPALEAVAHRLQRHGPLSLLDHPSTADAIAWAWQEWTQVTVATFDDQVVWLYTHPDTGHWVAFDLGSAAARWADMNAEDRYWACLTPVLTTRRDQSSHGTTLFDLIERMHARVQRGAWVLAAEDALAAETEAAVAARFLIGLGGGGTMGQLLIRRQRTRQP